MKKFKLFGVLGVGLLIIIACSPTITTPTINVQKTMTTPPAIITFQPASMTVPPTTQQVASFPLAERGPYWTGNRVYTFVDESRDGRKIEIQIYYPGIISIIRGRAKLL